MVKKILLMAVVVLAGCTTQRGPTTAARFHLEAIHMFYSALERSWEVKIDESAKPTFQLFGEEEHEVTLSPRAVAELTKVMIASDVFSLKDSYGELPVDGPERRIDVQMDGKRKRITIYSLYPSSFTDDQQMKDVARLLKVWAAIRSTFNHPTALDSREYDLAFLAEIQKANIGVLGSLAPRRGSAP